MRPYSQGPALSTQESKQGHTGPTSTPKNPSTQLHSGVLFCPRRPLTGLLPMVSVGKLSAGQARYYLDQAATPVSAGQALTTGIEDYYLGGPEAAGRWVGRGALVLGLEGRVDDAGFEA